MTILKDAIDDVYETYASAVNAGDMDRWITLWIEDGIQMPPDNPRNIGKEKIKSVAENLANLFHWKMVINCEEVKETSDWGYATGIYTVKLTPKDGGKTIKGSGKFLTILEKQDNGSWKIARDIFNYDAPLQ